MKQLPFIQELTEARLFFDVKDVKGKTAKELSEIVYYIFLLIEVWRLNKPSEAALYATQTMQYDDYRTMHYSATDLANLLAVLNNQDVFSSHIKVENGISIPEFQINRYLRDVAKRNKPLSSEDQTFFWRLEDYLKVYGNSTIRQLRRDISNWSDLTYANKMQALSILRREFDKRGSTVDIYLRFKQEFKLKESINESKNPTNADIKSVSEWMNTSVDNLIIDIKQEPIDKFISSIKEMYSTYEEFPRDAQRTKKIITLLKNGELPLPIYVEKNDPHLFVMEGRHRMVAFWLYGLTTIPVAYYSKKINESVNLIKDIQYHKTLNPKLWANEELREDVKEALLKIAKKFTEFLDVEKFKIIDYIITGSNCAFNYTSHSDIDLHVLLDTSSLTDDTLTEPFLMAKKSLWNSGHDITVKGYNVELYAEDINDKDTLVATGIYSLLDDKWIKKPKYEEITIDDTAVKSKVTDIIHRINDTIETKSAKDLVKLMEQIRKMRSAGLEENGEFSVENLAFKVLRNGGYLDKIYKIINKEEDAELTLENANENNNLVEIAKRIANNCKPFLKSIEVDSTPLFRGQLKGRVEVLPQLFKSTTLEVREPLNSSKENQDIADEWFNEKFGIYFRSNHIAFAVSDSKQAGHYGKKSIFIPKGDFQFCWSPTIRDMNDILPKEYEIHFEIEDLNNIENAEQLDKDEYTKYRTIANKKLLTRRLQQGSYRTTDLPLAISSKKEIMFHCKEYYLLDVSKDEYKQIIQIAKGLLT